jgi:hypothetical protein
MAQTWKSQLVRRKVMCSVVERLAEVLVDEDLVISSS